MCKGKKKNLYVSPTPLVQCQKQDDMILNLKS